MKIAVIIPARLAATRLPRKPLALIGEKTMIEHVYDRAVLANIGPVFVACDGEEIASVIEANGGQAIITDPALASGTDRVYAALATLDADRTFDAVINLQGDLPNIDHSIIKATADLISDTKADIATAVSAISDPEEINSPSVVKVAIAFADGVQRARALYFSRNPIPAGWWQFYHHIGIYGYKRAALERFVALPPSLLEQHEKLEQLRAIEDGMTIDACLVTTIPQAVDTAIDLEKVRTLMSHVA